MVSAILWGNYHRLARGVLEELHAGGNVLQLASVYGPFSLQLLEVLGTNGALDVVEVAPPYDHADITSSLVTAKSLNLIL